ncbi:putative LPS assembly protein LptD [Algoriphagus halophytocola]|uniref:LPS assembly protein LptD n=1 Tax=Algoriphagus halophytocola TaxID=2991499 RepID=A0ABY6MII8_9BACT|nr:MULTISPECIES: putative LPS assembly protein LptD [unclassified Algoriphagus]UZD22799.1 putative LPS assembly protein LptD [Algoriphagus sp. TR-M5]WBL44065.1 putative LPS assembly protein LptD [Algoriphagus sp. TR-M9]
MLSTVPLSTSAQRTTGPPQEKPIVVPDTLLSPDPELTALDTIPIPADSLSLSDSTKIMPANDITTDITYYAEDSIVADFPNNKLYLHNQAWFEYGEMRLEADLIVIDWANSELYASGVTDSLGNITGNPFFKDGPSVYEIRKEMRYNFKSQKAIIKDVVTEQQDGILRGETIKKTDDGSIYLDHGYYTTCKLTTPHWHISSNKIKSIEGGQVVSGPFNLYFNGIPTPLGLPFGIIPNTPEEKASGIIFPSYGQEQARGLYLRDFGYYFAINDYIHTRITGDIYSLGGWGVKNQTAYRKRYRFAGSMNIDFQKFRSPETEENPVDYNTFRIAWSHTPESRGNSRFSASVNAGSTSYFNNIINPNNYYNNTTADLSSNVNYTKTFTGTPFTFSAAMRHSQSVQTGEVQLSLPTMSIGMNRQRPFENVKFEPLKTLNFSYNFDMQNTITNKVDPSFGVDPDLVEDLDEPELVPFTPSNFGYLLDNANNGARNRIPISSNFTLFNYFTGTASGSLTELWYLKKINYYYNPSEERVDKILEDGFNRVTYYNTSFSLATNIYGFFNFKKGNVKTIRQHIQPTFGFSYTPDFSDPSLGYYQEVQTDAEGNTALFSRHQGFSYSGAPSGLSKALSINIRSVLEAKVLDKKDSTDQTATKKIPILENIDLSTSYNFAADSFNLAPFRISARTSFFERRLSVNMATTLDPYATQAYMGSNGTESFRSINDFAWNNGQGIGTIRSATLNMNASINPSNAQNQGEVRDELTNQFIQQGGVMNDFVESEINRIATDPSQYIDWDIPWNLSFGYVLSYNKAVSGRRNITQTVSVNGDFSLSEKWKINFNTGFDAQAKEITQTMVGIARDLHCWQMNVNWIPFGRFTSYNIDIRVKSTILQDLKVSRRRSFFDR